MRGMLRPHRPRAGVTVGWLLAALAVVVVVVIVAILLWPAGPEPGADEAPPAAEEELPGEEAPDEAAAPEEDGEEPAAPDEDAEAAELEPEEDAEADAPPDEEAAEAEAEAPPEDEADGEEARADADRPADEEAGPGPVDARVEGAEDVELQADARNREIEAGGALADATRRTVTAMAEVETELRGLQAARAGERAAPAAEPLQVEGPSPGADARVQEPTVAAMPDVAGLQEAANGAARGERPDGAAEISLGAAEAREQAPPSDERTRRVDVSGAVGAVQAARDRGQRVEPSEFTDAASPSIDLGEVEGRQADVERRVRTISLDPRAADGAFEQTRQALERAEFSSRPATPSNQ